jgi:hypothetical protein
MKQSHKLLIALLLLGLSFLVTIGIIIFKLNSGETLLVKRQAFSFLKLISDNNYSNAFKYVDPSQISIKEVEEISSIASHYVPNATYFYQSSKNVYIIGYKKVKYDKDPVNDNKLEFFISKVKGKWKVTYISYRH